MKRLTKNGITTLKKQYKSVLLKCLAINTGVFMLATPVMALEISQDTSFTAKYTGDNISYNENDMGGQGALHIDDDFIISGGTNDIDTHVLIYPQHDFENGHNITIKGGETTLNGVSLNAMSGGLTISGGVINLDNLNFDASEDITLWAAKDITISGGTINMNGDEAGIDTVYDWIGLGEGPESAGNIYISGGTINVNNAETSISSTNKVDISGGTINVSKDGQLDINDFDDGTSHGFATVSGEVYFNGERELSEVDDGYQPDIWVNGNLQITENGNLKVSKMDMKTINGDITVAGKLTLEDSVLEAGNDCDSAECGGATEDNSNISLNGATVTATNSDIEANGNITISGGTLTSKTTERNEHGWNYGIWADKDITIKDNTQITLDDSYIDAAGDINISDSKITATDSDIFVQNALTIKDSIVSLTNASLSDSDAINWIEKGYGEFENAPENLSGISTGGEIVVDNSTLKLTKSYLDTMWSNGQIAGMEISGDKTNITMDMTRADVGAINMSGGVVDLKNNSELHGMYKINVSNGTVNLGENAELMVDVGDDGRTGIFSLSGGTINFNENGAGIGVELPGGNQADGSFDVTAAGGDFDMTGGTINVNAKNAIITANEMSMTNGEINVKDGAEVMVIKEAGCDANGNLTDVKYTDISMGDKSVINLAGTLKANIGGNDKGLINVNSANAKIEGDVNSIDLGFNSDATLSKLVTGTIGDLSDVTISKGKTLTFDKEMRGTITTVNVEDGATLDIGTNILRSTGDKENGEGIIFADNSKLKLTITDKEIYGKVLANYVKIGEKGTTLNMNFNSAVVAQDETVTFKIFDKYSDENDVEIEGQFANLTNNSRFSIVDNKDGSYDVTNTKSASDVVEEAGGSSNNASTAEAWDNVDTGMTNNSVIVAIAQKLAELSGEVSGKVKEYLDALTALAPEVAPAVQQTATETAGQVFGAVGTRLSGGSVSSGRHGMSSGDNPFTKVAVWVQGLFNKAELDDTSKSKGFDSKTYGTAMGIEGKLDNVPAKVGIGYAYSKTDIDGFMRDTDAKTHTAILYGEYKPSNWYVNTVLSYGWSDYDEKKNVAGVGVKANWDVESFAMQTMTGYDMFVNGYGITPEAGLRYVHVKQDAYKDSADQRVSGNNSDIITAVLGTKVKKAVQLENGSVIIPEVKAAMTYDLKNDKANSVVTLANGASYTSSGTALDRFGIEVGAGLTAEVNDNVELYFGYEGKFRDDYEDHTGLINVKYNF